MVHFRDHFCSLTDVIHVIFKCFLFLLKDQHPHHHHHHPCWWMNEESAPQAKCAFGVVFNPPPPSPAGSTPRVPGPGLKCPMQPRRSCSRTSSFFFTKKERGPGFGAPLSRSHCTFFSSLSSSDEGVQGLAAAFVSVLCWWGDALKATSTSAQSSSCASVCTFSLNHRQTRCSLQNTNMDMFRFEFGVSLMINNLSELFSFRHTCTCVVTYTHLHTHRNTHKDTHTLAHTYKAVDKTVGFPTPHESCSGFSLGKLGLVILSKEVSNTLLIQNSSKI